MGTFDWIAILFSFTTVAFAITGELLDIELCEIAVARAPGEAKAGVRFALKFLNAARRWVFLPCLTACIPSLVWMLGGDALSVCFNTVAILFLVRKTLIPRERIEAVPRPYTVACQCQCTYVSQVEIDTVCYAGLPRRMRERMAEAGRLMLTEAQATTMARTKAVHVCAFVLIMMYLITWRGEPPGGPVVGFFVSSVPFIIGGCFEGCQQDTPASTLRDVVKAFAAGVIGFLVWFLVAYLSLAYGW